jgi:type I restriction enzyme S subunit
MKSVAPNLADLKPNLEWASLPLFDRKRWKRVRFGDVVENCAETCDPQEAGLERFIAMEHLEPGSLHIRSWGNVADGTTFTRRCRPGQVLFGKRRAYQRKVAVAEFEAVVSGDIYVLKPKNESLLAELLPYLCLSERFFEHAVGTSAGSLSPRTNWSSLASFEFDLPPLDQQRRIAEILWAVDESQTKWQDVAHQHTKSLYAFASTVTLHGLASGRIQDTPIGAIPAKWRCLRVDDVTESSAYGPRFPASSYATDGNTFQVRTTDYDRLGGINFSKVPAARLEEKVVSTHRLRDGDFLLSRSGEYAGLTAVFREPDDGRVYIPGAFLIRYRFTDELHPDFLIALCDSEFGDRYVKPLATGSAQPNISGSAFGHLMIPVPPVSEQREILAEIRKLQTAGDKLRGHAAQTRTLLTAFLNTIN